MYDIGIKIPEILIPKKEIDYYKWSVVACDQYTSQMDYWDEVEKIIGQNPSTYNLIFPEAYLNKCDMDDRIKKINNNMIEYLNNGIFDKPRKGFIYLERQTLGQRLRKGLILAVDLEKYDYNEGSQSLIRATEGTVIDRLPPRIKIRKNAILEVPHVMVLIDDSEKTVIEPLTKEIDNMELLYDFDLMMGGGHLKGYCIADNRLINSIQNALQKLAEPDLFKNKYGVDNDKGILLFAVGDGNHSLAAAKAHWESIKKDLPLNEWEAHPARYSLVEVVNIHDEGLEFEPIHRALFDVDKNDLFTSMESFFVNKGSNFYIDYRNDIINDLEDLNKNDKQIIGFLYKDAKGTITIENPKHTLAVGSLQMFLDEYVKMHNVRIDYIHGNQTLLNLCEQDGNIGFLLPSINKNDFFRTIIKDGVLPRKTFSMGEANEKRYYMECRKITR